jgi:hypothetical protein
MAVPKVTYMPVDQLALMPEFRKLKPRHAEWVRLYLQEFIRTGIFDHNAVTKVVYPSPIAVRIRSTAHYLRHNPNIQSVVKLFLDSAEGNLATDLAEVQRHLDACQPGSIAAQRLLSLKNGLKRGRYVEDADEPQNPNPAVTSSPRRSQIGMVIPYDGGFVRITAEDESGTPTAGDPCTQDGTPIPENRPE